MPTKASRPRIGKPTEPKQQNQDTVSAIREARKDIIEGLIAKAREGSCQHAKFLFEYAGLLPGGGESEDDGPSLARLLLDQLRELGMPDDPELNATEVPADESV